MIFSVAILGITVVLAIVFATRQPVALLSFLAYPVLFAGTYVICVVIRLTGRSGQWERMSQVDPTGTMLHLQLRTTGHPMLMLRSGGAAAGAGVLRAGAADPAGGREPGRGGGDPLQHGDDPPRSGGARPGSRRAGAGCRAGPPGRRPRPAVRHRDAPPRTPGACELEPGARVAMTSVDLEANFRAEPTGSWRGTRRGTSSGKVQGRQCHSCTWRCYLRR